MKFILIVVFIVSCSSYKLRSRDNPFSQFGIRSISVPTFYNYSNLHNVSVPFTKEVYFSMLEYKGLKIKTKNSESDAVLVGIIESPTKLRDTIESESRKSIKNTYGSDLLGEKRKDFVLPSSNKIELTLRVIVIKHPRKEELEILKTELGRKAMSSRIIFNELIPVSTTYNLKENQGTGIKVNGTQNRGLSQVAVNALAQSAASGFKDIILYAF